MDKSKEDTKDDEKNNENEAVKKEQVSESSFYEKGSDLKCSRYHQNARLDQVERGEG